MTSDPEFKDKIKNSDEIKDKKAKDPTQQKDQ
jgi:hypothetical protein